MSDNSIIKEMSFDSHKGKNTIKKDERIDESIKRISKALNLLEATSERLEAACDEHGWDKGVVYQIQDAARNLGFSLATLNRWYDDDVMGYCDEECG